MFQSIRLQNFRSYHDAGFEFEPGVNIIVGPNGSGKTNLLEAILVACVGKSYRVGDQDVINFDSEWARLDAQTDNHVRVIKLQKNDLKMQKNYDLDGKNYKILSLQNSLPVVLFEPNHLNLLNGKPDLRRNYLDDLLEQTIPNFKSTRRQYKRVLAQRNSLLKQTKRPSKDQLFVWDLRLSELGGAIVRHRLELVEEIRAELQKLYNEVSGDKNTHIDAEYISKLPQESYESSLLKALELSLEHDLRRGFTSFGPHRDDLLVNFNSRPASEVASRGETRTALLAFKINELKIVEKARNEKPILLLDDVFSELDGRRRHALANFLKIHQTFITTTDADLVLKEKVDSSNIIPLNLEVH